MTTDAFSFFVEAARGAARHPEGWDVRTVDRHHIEYRDGEDLARVDIEDVVGGVVIYAKTVEWLARSTPEATNDIDVLARCALALQALGFGDASVDWSLPRWGTTGQDEVYGFASRCVVRLHRERGVVEYEDAKSRKTLPLERTTIGDGEARAWMIRPDGELPAAVMDRIVQGILYLTGEPVQVRTDD